MEISTKDFCPRIGGVYYMQFGGICSEQSGFRPGVVFQNNIGNRYSPNIIAIPMTRAIKKLYMPTHVLIKSANSGLRFDSLAICENPEAMSKQRVEEYITRLPDEYMKQIAIANLIATGAISFLNMRSLLGAWKKAKTYNNRTA